MSQREAEEFEATMMGELKVYICAHRGDEEKQ